MNRFLTRRTLAAAAAAVVLAVAGGAVAQQQIATAAAEISIKNFAFDPPTLTVAPGTSVTWVNNDEEPHNIVSASNPRAFRSKAIDGDEKFSFVFDTPGTYTYICSVHPHMHGTVVVK